MEEEYSVDAEFSKQKQENKEAWEKISVGVVCEDKWRIFNGKVECWQLHHSMLESYLCFLFFLLRSCCKKVTKSTGLHLHIECNHAIPSCASTAASSAATCGKWVCWHKTHFTVHSWISTIPYSVPDITGIIQSECQRIRVWAFQFSVMFYWSSLVFILIPVLVISLFRLYIDIYSFLFEMVYLCNRLRATDLFFFRM